MMSGTPPLSETKTQESQNWKILSKIKKQPIKTKKAKPQKKTAF